MFEQTFNALDNILRHEDGCATALDYAGQTSWMLFLKCLDDMEHEREIKSGRLLNSINISIINVTHRYCSQHL